MLAPAANTPPGPPRLVLVPTTLSSATLAPMSPLAILCSEVAEGFAAFAMGRAQGRLGFGASTRAAACLFTRLACLQFTLLVCNHHLFTLSHHPNEASKSPSHSRSAFASANARAAASVQRLIHSRPQSSINGQATSQKTHLIASKMLV
ncbi:hypothetical protein BDR03DRAFT_1009471 [Suillus americanus]|nr:hypothetical protein BDR03DRAFT_1009471 [Suillus americanus]